jgi:hypothetical protein
MNESVAAMPEGVCSMCKQPEEIVGELVMHEVAYPYSGSQRQICNECRSKLNRAIEKTLESVGWY